LAKLYCHITTDEAPVQISADACKAGSGAFFNQFYKHQRGFELGASSVVMWQYNSANQPWLLLLKHSTIINN